MMLSFVLTATLALRVHGTSAASQTPSLNSTTTSSSRLAVTEAPTGDCSNDCTLSDTIVYTNFVSWSQLPVIATYTAETVVFIVNKRSNSTRTTTISNTDIDIGRIAAPTNVNSDGTVTASIVDSDGSTRIVAYPTSMYGDYTPNITWTGTLSTTVSGTPTCSVAPTGAVAVFPSNTPTEGVQATGINTIEDPRGWTFVNLGDFKFGDHKSGDATVEELFPDLGIWNCGSPPAFNPAFGPLALETALYLTKTSTSTEPDDGPTSIAAPQPSTPPAQLGKIVLTADTPTLNAPPAESGQPFGPPPAPASKSIVITPSPTPVSTLPTAPVAIPVPVTSTDSKGSITISTSTAVVYPIIISSTNAQGSIVFSTSLSTASVFASLPTILTSTNAQGTVLSSTVHLPAIILITTNAAGSKVLTTSALSAFAQLASAPPPIIVNGETITPNAQSQYIISSQTLSPGSSITLGSGASTTVLALQTSSGTTALVYGPSTSLLPSGTNPAALTIGTQTITPNAQSQYLISGSTLAPGSTITLGSGPSTTVLALQTSGPQTALIYEPRTSLLPPAAVPTTPPAITIGSETITANSRTEYVIGSQTLTPGGAVTVSGTEVSLAAGGSDVVVGSSTEALGPYITAGFGSGANGTTGGTFAAGAGGGRGSGWREVWRVGVVGVGIVVAL